MQPVIVENCAFEYEFEREMEVINLKKFVKVVSLRSFRKICSSSRTSEEDLRKPSNSRIRRQQKCRLNMNNGNWNLRAENETGPFLIFPGFADWLDLSECQLSNNVGAVHIPSSSLWSWLWILEFDLEGYTEDLWIAGWPRASRKSKRNFKIYWKSFRMDICSLFLIHWVKNRATVYLLVRLLNGVIHHGI